MWEQYVTPSTLDEAVHAIAEYAPQGRVIAGATDLMLELERGLRAETKTLIDISRIPDLGQISDEDGWIRLGPLVTHNQCAASPLIRDRATALAYACWQVGAPQIRNRGTIAGNLITASPANDSIPPLLALDAQITLRSRKGERHLSLDEFYTGVRQTVMDSDEILTEIRFPAGPKTRRSAFFKLGLRRAQAISVVNAAIVLDFDGEAITDAEITLGSVAPLVVHAKEAADILLGKTLNLELIEQAADLAMNAATPIDDLRGSAAYRMHMVKICVLRALRDLLNNQEMDHLPEEPVMLWGEKKALSPGIQDGLVMHNLHEPIETTINGEARLFQTGQNKSLLRLLREEGGLIGTKEGCAEGECGACTIFLDGAAVMACLVPAPRAHGAEIVTIEGLADGGELHPVQQAFVNEGAVQCGYCTPGFVMSGVKLLEERDQPSREEIAQALTGNLCRCTGYYKILSAIEKAAAVQHA
jgi:xanthine dehydrogenase iron-sulfur cluster and FAD-binding subunit A